MLPNVRRRRQPVVGGGAVVATAAEAAEGGEAVAEPRLRVCMVCDFFYPNVGGVEQHVLSLAVALRRRGHHVVVATHAYDDAHQGVRVTRVGAVRVYYLPLLAFYNQTTFPAVFASTSLLREVFVRERITLVHAHQAFSTLASDALRLAGHYGVPSVFTDHSLFGFGDAASVLTNKLLKMSMANVDRIVCVSHTSKENFVLRCQQRPSRIVVIPNAIDAAHFVPDTARRRPPPAITVVAVSRLVYRKGVDLLVALLPELCRLRPQVNVIVAGDGDRRVDVELAREAHRLHDRVELLGAVGHEAVRDVLVRGHIFLNCSLTEAFCMAIVEAAACGLLVVATDVGGVPEVLPQQLVRLASPSVPALLEALLNAVDDVAEGRCMPAEQCHALIRDHTPYNWAEVARRTETAYREAAARRRPSLLRRMRRLRRAGAVYGLGCIALTFVQLLYWCLLAAWRPVSVIERALDLPLDADGGDNVGVGTGLASGAAAPMPRVGGAGERGRSPGRRKL